MLFWHAPERRSCGGNPGLRYLRRLPKADMGWTEAVAACPVRRDAMFKRLLLTCGALCLCITAAHAEDTVRAAEVRSIGSGATLTAIDRGYFKDQGIKVELDAIDSSANAIALLAQSRYQVIEGGLSAGFFNGLEKDLPIVAVAGPASPPPRHQPMNVTGLQGHGAS